MLFKRSDHLSKPSLRVRFLGVDPSLKQGRSRGKRGFGHLLLGGKAGTRRVEGRGEGRRKGEGPFSWSVGLVKVGLHVRGGS